MRTAHTSHNLREGEGDCISCTLRRKEEIAKKS